MSYGMAVTEMNENVEVEVELKTEKERRGSV